MKKEANFTETHKLRLELNIDEVTKYLQDHTGWYVEMNVERDKSAGYIYSIKIALDPKFKKHAKWLIYSTGKQAIKNELLQNISHFDFHQNKKLGSTTQKSKQVKSSAITIECLCCGDVVKPHQIFRNIKSKRFNFRGGYTLYCNNCVFEEFQTILKERDIYFAYLWVCGFYDKKFDVDLINTVMGLSLSNNNSELKEYFRRLNLTQYKGLNNGKLFADSDIPLLPNHKEGSQ